MDNNNRDLSKYKLPLIIGGILASIVIIIFLVSKLIGGNNLALDDGLYYITLDGETNIILYQGDVYQEPGYKGTDDNGRDLTKKIVVTNNIDSNQIGNYKVTYTLGSATKERLVRVIEKPAGATYIYLYGDINMFLYVGETYKEPGYEVVDSVDGAKLKDLVKVTSDVNTSKEGIYKVVYTVTNTGGVTTSKERTVIVMDRSLSLIPNTSDLTNNNVTINIYARDELFSYLTLPNGSKVTARTSAYQVSNNGTYKFVMYNTSGQAKEKSIEITNIDKETPSGSCSGYYQNGSSYINVSAKDNAGISHYVINGTSYTSNNITVSNEFTTVNITICDKAGNSKDISCTLTNRNTVKPSSSSTKPSSTSSSKPSSSSSSIKPSSSSSVKPSSSSSIKPSSSSSVKPSSSSSSKPSSSSPSSSSKPSSSTGGGSSPIGPPANISYTFDTATLKVWIEKTEGYYTSHIWVKNAYNQLKTMVPNNFGGTLEGPSYLLNDAAKKFNLQNKAVIAVNGSGFVLKGNFATAFYSANHEWNMTSESPLVMFEGRVLRDFSAGNIPTTVVTYGLKSNGDLDYYEYVSGTNMTQNINNSNKIKSDGVLYTVGFKPALVKNGQVLSTDRTPNVRQGFCQIDKNNFVFITNRTGSNTSAGFSFKTLGDYMVSLGCKTGVNLDGGGSATLLTKDKNNNITKYYGNIRDVADILFFHE